MKREIYNIHPELKNAPDYAYIQLLLVNAVKEAWHSLKDIILNNLCDIMDHRV